MTMLQGSKKNPYCPLEKILKGKKSTQILIKKTNNIISSKP
jgi:hypothetical protein